MSIWGRGRGKRFAFYLHLIIGSAIIDLASSNCIALTELPIGCPLSLFFGKGWLSEKQFAVFKCLKLDEPSYCIFFSVMAKDLQNFD